MVVGWCSVVWCGIDVILYLVHGLVPVLHHVIAECTRHDCMIYDDVIPEQIGLLVV